MRSASATNSRLSASNSRRRIELHFGSVQEALQQLFTLAQAITHDYDRFAALVSGEPGSHTERGVEDG